MILKWITGRVQEQNQPQVQLQILVRKLKKKKLKIFSKGYNSEEDEDDNDDDEVLNLSSSSIISNKIPKRENYAIMFDLTDELLKQSFKITSVKYIFQ